MNKQRKGPLEIDREKLLETYKALDPTKKEIKENIEKILGMSASEIRKYEIERIFANCLNKKIEFRMFDPVLFGANNVLNRGIIRSLVSIGIMDKNFNWEDEYVDKIPGISPKNYSINYKSWLGEKLLLTGEEIQKFSVDRINGKANKLLALAIDHIDKYFNDKEMIPAGLEGRFKSPYYIKIHAKGSDQMSFFELLRMYYRITKAKKILKKNIEKNEFEIGELEMALFEIQRIFGLAVLYNDRERNHEFEKLGQDKVFIRNRFGDLIKNDSGKEHDSCPYPDSIGENIECPNVTKNKVYMTKNLNGTYIISGEEPVSKNYLATTTLNSAILKGRVDSFRRTETKVKLRHIAIRGVKSGPAAVDKVIMKGLSSFTEIMDQKGMILVVDSYDDADKIEALLTNEIGTRETSWEEEFKFVGVESNNQTSASYKAKKGILKVKYKAEDIELIIKNLVGYLKDLKTEVEKNCNHDQKIQIEIKNIEGAIDYLKSRAKKGKYNIRIEILLFDVTNYVKAEFDEKSPAYHGKYKNNQRALDVFPKLFPVAIYGESTMRQFLIPVIKRKMKLEGKY